MSRQVPNGDVARALQGTTTNGRHKDLDLLPSEVAIIRFLTQPDNVDKIEINDLGQLTKAFATASSGDPYYISAAYYGLTCRRGLFMYRHDKGNTVLFGLHPNVHNRIIIFPPFGPHRKEALQGLLEVLSPIKTTIQMGRVPIEDKNLIKAAHKIEGYKAEVREEEILDWRFPIPTTNLEKLRAKEGKIHAPLRQALNSIEREYRPNADDSRLNKRRINFQDAQDVELVRQLVHDWENSAAISLKHSHRKSYDVTGAPYFDYLIEMARASDSSLQGLFMIVDGRPYGFSIWESPVGDHMTANIFASQVAFPKKEGEPAANDNNKDRESPHLTTGLIYITGRTIQDLGGQNMSLGGSETPGQYRFKIDKFPPVNEQHLTSIEFTPI